MLDEVSDVTIPRIDIDRDSLNEQPVILVVVFFPIDTNLSNSALTYFFIVFVVVFVVPVVVLFIPVIVLASVIIIVPCSNQIASRSFLPRAAYPGFFQ